MTCGCQIEEEQKRSESAPSLFIRFCPLHREAGRLRDACLALMEALRKNDTHAVVEAGSSIANIVAATQETP